MRTSNDICLLCKENKATQRNTHLIPKFFGKGLFYGTNPRHGIAIDKAGKKQRVQDILKENYLLCPICEKGISVFEAYCILRLDRYNNIRYLNKFARYSQGGYDYFECKDLDIRIFNLFVYSIVWRVSVNENFVFGSFKLPEKEEEKLRRLLKEFIKSNQTELSEKIDELKGLPNHSHIIIRPVKQLRPPNSDLSAASMDGWLHELHLVDYIILYSTEREKLSHGLLTIDNNNLINHVKVGMIATEIWKYYNYETIINAIK